MTYIATDIKGKSIEVVTGSYQGVCFHNGSIKSYERMEEIAAELTEQTGVIYGAIDRGCGVSPRFDVMVMPQVGDEISYGFNGDYYPCGKIATISKSGSVITSDDGKRFYRRKLSGAWKYQQTWTMVPGHISERNPSF